MPPTPEKVSAAADERVWRRAVAAGERHRARMSSDLDDHAVQPLAAALLGMDAAAMALERGQTDEAAQMLLQSRGMVRSVTQRLRSLLFELRPPSLDSGGVVSAARSLIGQFRRETGIRVSLEGDLPRLEPEAEITLYRALQESLANVARHAEAASVDVRFELEGSRAVMEVRDDGAGFDPGESGEGVGYGGLAAIRTRVEWLGGKLEVRAAPGVGTVVAVHIPL